MTQAEICHGDQSRPDATEPPLDRIDRNLLDDLGQLEPFGTGFPAPVFEVAARVSQVKAMGDGSHWRLTLAGNGGQRHTAVWFGATESGASTPPLEVSTDARLVVAINRRLFRGKEQIQLIVRTAEAVGAADSRDDLARHALA